MNGMEHGSPIKETTESVTNYIHTSKRKRESKIQHLTLNRSRKNYSSDPQRVTKKETYYYNYSPL